MAILKLISNNPNLSLIIYKHPNGGLCIRPIRKGFGFGYYAKNTTNDITKYNVVYMDSPGQTSYPSNENDGYDYMNSLKYVSPICYINILTEFFTGTLNKNFKTELHNDTYYYEMEFNLIKIDSNSLVRYLSFFNNLDVKYKNVISKVYNLTIKSKNGINAQEFINTIYLLMILICCTNKEYFEISDSQIIKLAKIIENHYDSISYYIRYIIVSRLLTGRKNLFDKLKNQLEKSSINITYELNIGDTAIQRRNYIESLLKFDKPIIDIGCGEGFYAIPFSKKNKNINYYAIDIDKNEIAKLKKKISINGIKNIKIFDSFDEFISFDYEKQKFDIIITEVVEHMEKDESINFIKNVIDCDELNYDKIIITTPNKGFNKYYYFDDNDMRHDDHKWEPTKNEFEEFINEIMKKCKNSYMYNMIDIGDKVIENGNILTPTQGCIIQKVEI
jgi:hypothetical protein